MTYSPFSTIRRPIFSARGSPRRIVLGAASPRAHAAQSCSFDDRIDRGRDDQLVLHPAVAGAIGSAEGGGGKPAGGRIQAPADAKARDRRSAHRRHRSRFQQPADDRDRQSRHRQTADRAGGRGRSQPNSPGHWRPRPTARGGRPGLRRNCSPSHVSSRSRRTNSISTKRSQTCPTC